MTNHHQPEKPKSNRKLISMLVMGCIGMFGFGFALVPLYDVLCEKLGINGKTSNTASSYQAITIDTSRIVTVEFISQVQTGMPWKFEPQTKRLEVHPGELIHTAFFGTQCVRQSHGRSGDTLNITRPRRSIF